MAVNTRNATRTPAKRPARTEAAEHLSRADRVAKGKDARAFAPLESHAEFEPDRGRDPIGLLIGQAESRVPELIPIVTLPLNDASIADEAPLVNRLNSIVDPGAVVRAAGSP